MKLPLWSRCLLLLQMLIMVCSACFANENLFREARTLQRDGKHAEAIASFKKYLTQPVSGDSLSNKEQTLYTEALMQLMNTFQSKGEPEACITTLEEVFKGSPAIQRQCLRDYYSILGYALSRTERMKEAEETTMKALALPLHQPTPENYFRDENKTVVKNWSGAANLLFTNWLNYYVYQVTPYDVKR